jgi:signal transduction histidine kinase/HAMP domain-containing protein
MSRTRNSDGGSTSGASEDPSLHGTATDGSDLHVRRSALGGDRSFRWVAAALLGVAGLLLNLFTIPMSPGVDLIFGAVAYLLAAVALGPGPGLLAAGIASVRTVWLWNHPFAWLIFSAEGFTVGYIVHRWKFRPLTADALYWLFLGVPLLLLTYGLILGVSGTTAVIIFLKQPFNGLISALAAEALLLIPMIRRALQVTGAPRLRSALAVVVTISATVPTLAFGIWVGQRDWAENVARARERITLYAATHASKLEQYVRLHEGAVRSVAQAAERRGVFDPEQLQRLVAVEHEQFPGFVNVYAADSRGVSVAFDPLVAPGGRSLLGLDFSDRPYYSQLLATRETVISDVFLGRGAVDEPLIVITHPIILADTFAGYVLGALDLKALPTLDLQLAASERLRVADAHGTLIIDNNSPHRAGDQPRTLADSSIFAAIQEVGDLGTTTYITASAVAPAAITAAQVFAGVARIPSLGWWVWVEQPLLRVQALVAQSYIRLLVLLIALTLIALLVSDRLAHFLAGPLLRLRATSAALAAGDLRARVGPLPAVVPMEINELGRGFDEMAESLAERTEELEEIGEIARFLASTLDTEELLRRITDTTARLLDADGCGLALLEADHRTLRTAPYSMGLLAPAAGSEVPIDGSLVGWVTRTGQPALVADALADPRVFRSNIEHTQPGSLICAPLSGRSGPLGALIAARSRSREKSFDHADLSLLRRLASHAAIAVENAHLVAQAQAASRAKSDFIATMSHELRTPLNAVIGHLQLLQMEVHGSLTAQQREALERIGAASIHLRGLIEEVLSFARLEAGRIPVNIVDTDLCALVRDVAAVIEPLAHEKRLQLTAEDCMVAEPVPTDPDRVRQILINLTGNAVKFTDEGEVRIRVESRNGEIILSVADTGAGISNADKGRLFRPFEQLETGLSRAHGGTGLGLYLSSRYAAVIGGRIEVESEVGKGSVFSLIIPQQGPGDVQADESA